jgi:ribulose-phosphate 3-epimerase
MIDASGYSIRLEVDGGIGLQNLAHVAEAGADVFVAGSAIFRPPHTFNSYAATISEMRRILHKVNP